MLTVHGLLGFVVLQGGDLLLAQGLLMLQLGCRLVELHWLLLLGGKAWLHDVMHHLGLACGVVETIVICHFI